MHLSTTNRSKLELYMPHSKKVLLFQKSVVTGKNHALLWYLYKKIR